VIESTNEEVITNCIVEHRLGKFFLGRNFFMLATNEDLQCVFSHFVIVRAESMFVSHSVEYTAYSALFPTCNPACEPMVYNLVFQRDEDGAIKSVGVEEWSIK
jgi:hypothetical protein